MTLPFHQPLWTTFLQPRGRLVIIDQAANPPGGICHA
jgi:hypothetical protein